MFFILEKERIEPTFNFYTMKKNIHDKKTHFLAGYEIAFNFLITEFHNSSCLQSNT